VDIVNNVDGSATVTLSITDPVTLIPWVEDAALWAVAEQLTVRVDYPVEWGSSNPQNGPLTAGSVRKGFAFSVSFTPATGYSLTGWKACRTGDYAGASTAVFLPSSDVHIVNNVDGSASITINITDPVTLIPWVADAAAWDVAPQLTVRVDYPPEWGSSVQNGPLTAGSVRKGFAFNVDFTPYSGYRFIGWVACKAVDYLDADTTVFLSAAAVAIVPKSAGSASITINITDPVTLIPWCVNRALDNGAALPIRTEAELKTMLSANPNGIYALMNNIVLSENWTPIGTDAAPFKGKLYGNGFTVSGIRFTGTAPVRSGFFGVLDGAELSSLNLIYDNAAVFVDGEMWFGGIAGLVRGAAKISAITVDGSISVTQTGLGDSYEPYENKGIIFAGGAVGQVVGGNSPLILDGITVRSDFTVTASTAENENAFIGGLAGALDRADTTTGRIVLRNSHYIDGEIKFISTARAVNLGGAVGTISWHVTVEGCSAEALRITLANEAGGAIFGGFVGGIGSDISFSNCFSDTMVFMVNTSTSGVLYVGGFAGEIMGGGVLESCYALGDVDITASRSMHVGGLVGYTEDFGPSAIITQCYASGDVKGTSSGASDLFVGGLVGSANDAFIADCYALGNVVGNLNQDYRKNVGGGLVGYSNKTTIEHCFAAGTVSVTTVTYATGVYAGGIVGHKEDGTLTNNAALGASISYDGIGSVYVGRVLGENTGTDAPNTGDNFAWEDMKMNEIKYTGDSPTHGTRKTEDNFKNPAIWRNLGFNQSSLTSVLPWSLTSATSRGYPTLSGLGEQ
jgi:hypothetical protein